MGEQFGYLSRCSDLDVLATFEEAGFNELLAQQQCTNRFSLKKELSNYFLNGSNRRSYLFFQYNYRKYAVEDWSKDFYLPIYGVKGQQKVKRQIPYYCFYAASGQKLASADFIRQIFGTDYITEEEARTLPNPVERLGKVQETADFSINPKNKKLVTRIVAKLWELQCENPDSRLVLFMNDSEYDGMELLRQVYLLIPPRLRLNMGFAVNVESQDIQHLIIKNKLPIHILAVDKNQSIQEFARTGLFYKFDIDRSDSYRYNSELLNSLEMLCEMKSEARDILMKMAEQRMPLNYKKIVSFKYFSDLLKELYNQEAYWWSMKRNVTLKSLREKYLEQKEYTEYSEEIRQEALGIFHNNMLSEGICLNEIFSLVQKPKAEQDQEMVEFLKHELHCEALLGSVNHLISQKNTEIDTLRTHYEQERFELTEAHQNELTDLRTQHENTIRNLKAEHKKAIDTLTANYEAAISELKLAHQEALDELKKNQEAEIIKVGKENQKRLRELKAQHEKEIDLMKAAHEQEMEKIKSVHEADVLKINKAHEDELAEQKSQYEDQIEDLNQTQEEELAELTREHNKRLGELKKSHEAKVAEMEKIHNQQYETLEAELEKVKTDHEKELDGLIKAYRKDLSEKTKEIKRLKKQLNKAGMAEAGEVLEAIEPEEDKVAEVSDSFEVAEVTETKAEEKTNRFEKLLKWVICGLSVTIVILVLALFMGSGMKEKSRLEKENQEVRERIEQLEEIISSLEEQCK